MKHYLMREQTRRAILEALADVIIETDGIGFSVQTVADRAGVTHRTIYNHFPTREALCETFLDYVDELLLSNGSPPDLAAPLESFPAMLTGLYTTLEKSERYVRASVLLQIANRSPLSTWKTRTASLEKRLAREASAKVPLTPHQLTAVIRMFFSSIGWHLMTEQYGLSTRQAAAASAWATQTLLDAATGGHTPTTSRRAPKEAHTSRNRRN